MVIGLVIPIAQVSFSDITQPGLYAFQPDGLSGHAETNSTKLMPSNFTLAFWVKEENPWPTGNYLFGAFASSYYDNSSFPNSNTDGYGLLLEQNGAIRWVIGDGGLGPACYIASVPSV